MDAGLFETARTLRTEAHDILWRKGLHTLLRQYGQVDVTGRYVLQLMAWRDLDIYLVAPAIFVGTCFALGARIADLLCPVRMSFRNERLARTLGCPRGCTGGPIWETSARAGGRGIVPLSTSVYTVDRLRWASASSGPAGGGKW